MHDAGTDSEQMMGIIPRFPSDFRYQAALPAEKADRRIWRMMAIVRRFVFCIFGTYHLLYSPDMNLITLSLNLFHYSIFQYPKQIIFIQLLISGTVSMY